MNTINKTSDSKLEFGLFFYSNGNILISKRLKDDSFSDYKPITEDTKRDLAIYLSEVKKEQENFYIKGLIPRNIHYFDNDNFKVIWTTKAGVRHQLFKTNSNSIESGNYPVPNLIWCAKKNSLKVFAYKEINGEIELYKAPFLNTSSCGSVCLGNVKFDFKDKDYLKIIQKIEIKFYESYFTHTNDNALIDGNIVEFYKKYKNKKVFPEKLLIKSKQTYDSLYSLIH